MTSTANTRSGRNCGGEGAEVARLRCALRAFAARWGGDETFRLNVTYAVVMPIYVGLVITVFWWGIAGG